MEILSGSPAYLPGRMTEGPAPLSRYLPPVPSGVVTAWLRKHVGPGAWILDPFGAAPGLAAEAARAGYRVVVAANNPIARFLLEMASSPPTEADLRAALADLAATRRGDERLEPHMLSLYATTCASCHRQVSADAFVWERKASAPFARIYTCPHCGDKGERPTTEEDEANAARYATGGLHRARALERVAPVDDPDRVHAEEALEVYLPRAVYALFTLINKLEGLPSRAQQRSLLTALLITACDQGNTLWTYPAGRARPRQLTVPPRYYEHNLWKALENAIQEWARPIPPVPLTSWPEPPPPEGGISLFEGRLKDLTRTLPHAQLTAVVSALPRPNQAFWTLSALWSAWLWGREALGPFKGVLRRRRYDWSWHCSALHAAWRNLAPNLTPDTPMFGLIREAEPGLLSAALIAAQRSGFDLVGLAVREEPPHAQVTWKRALARPTRTEQAAPEERACAAGQALLQARGEPSAYLTLHTAALAALATQGFPDDPELSPADILNQTHDLLPRAFSYRRGFVRFGGSQHSLEVGQWWLRDPANTQAPLADRVEAALAGYLQAEQGSTLLQIDSTICAAFPGLLTPPTDLVLACLESYAELADPDTPGWYLREQELPEVRVADMRTIRRLIRQIGKTLGYRARGETPVVWESGTGAREYVFYVVYSAIIGDILTSSPHPADKGFIVLPGGRSNLVLFKLRRDPRLQSAVDEGWRFLKFRHVRRLAESSLLSRANMDDQFALDPLTYTQPQIPLL